MQIITLKIGGMVCGMCEAHINDAIRNAFPVKKVSSSRAKGITEMLTEEDIPDERLKAVIDETGYTFISAEREIYKKKGLFQKEQ